MANVLRTVNTLMSIGAKAHYMNGGNVRKADPKAKPQYTIEKVAKLLALDDVDELKQGLINSGITTEGGYILDERFGQGEKFNDYFIEALINTTNEEENDTNYNPKLLWTLIVVWCLLVGFKYLFSMDIFQAIVAFGICFGVYFTHRYNIYFLSKYEKGVNK